MKNKILVSPLKIVVFLGMYCSFAFGQTPPNNLLIDEENHRMSLQGLNTSSFYDEEVFESIYLEFEQSDYWQQLHDCYDTDNYVLGTLSYKGVEYPNIGARFKGNTSYSRVEGEKYSIAISLDEYIDGQDIEGYNTLNLNNAFQDASGMKEVLYSYLNRHNIPSAKANFVKLYINDEYWGVYSNVQQLNKDFTKEWFMTNNGSLWRADAPSTNEPVAAPNERPPGGGGGVPNWGDGTSALNYLGADTVLYQNNYTLKHSSQEEPWDLLVKLTDILNNTSDLYLYDSLVQYLDIDKTLWFLAHETVFTDDDSYIMKGKQDYYVYYEPETQRFVPLEFDGNSALDTKNVEWDLFYNEEKENYPLMNRLYALPDLRQRYLAHVRTIVDELLDIQLTDSLINKYDELISEAVDSETKSMFSYTEYQSGVEELKDYFIDRKRILWTNSELAEVGLAISEVEHKVNNELFQSPSEMDSVDITATIGGSKSAKKVYLYYSNYYVGRFIKTEMFDDGMHNDGASGDGVFGAEIPAFPLGDYVRYYVEAIADDEAQTATFSPPGAEHDVYFYRVGVPESVYSDVVINEICASNDGIVADNEGEFDDWIELYNNSSEAISLEGYYLTDDLAELSKWPLPAMSIAGNSYAIIWADDDEEQGEDHANFKLSSDGEELFLINPDGAVADHLLFGDQEINETWGRIPNGTGTFERTNLSFASENSVYIEELSSNIPVAEELDITVYPNPANDYLIVENPNNDIVSLRLYNLQGAMVYHTEVAHFKSIHTSDLQSGLYIVHLESGSSMQTIKIMIE